jgi:exopolyphosphatase/guanosine-5'-triphosphate,3'-diphosphate pyrophosphatase
LVGVAGTVTTLAAIAREIDPYDGVRVHGTRLSWEEVNAITTKLASLPLSARKQLHGLDPARADVIVAGSVLAEEILRWAGGVRGTPLGLVVSDRGVRWGLAERLCPV